MSSYSFTSADLLIMSKMSVELQAGAIWKLLILFSSRMNLAAAYTGLSNFHTLPSIISAIPRHQWFLIDKSNLADEVEDPYYM